MHLFHHSPEQQDPKRVMEMSKISVYTLLGVLALVLLVHCQDKSGFISIDCGISDYSTYIDATTGITYVSDTTFIGTGVSKTISPQFQSNAISPLFYTVRSFPEGLRNCYTLEPEQGRKNKYLIRASFMYGNYDGQSKPPEFDLHLGVNVWDAIQLNNSAGIVVKEILYAFR